MSGNTPAAAALALLGAAVARRRPILATAVGLAAAFLNTRGRADRERTWSFQQDYIDPVTVADVMTPSPIIVSPDATLAEAARLMRDHDIGWIPVGENDRLIGAVTDRDLAIRGLADMTETGTVRDVMTDEIVWCFEDEDVEEVLEDMADHSVGRLPVLNREKRLVGAITLSDVALADPERAATVGRRKTSRDTPSSVDQGTGPA